MPEIGDTVKIKLMRLNNGCVFPLSESPTTLPVILDGTVVRFEDEFIVVLYACDRCGRLFEHYITKEQLQ